MPLGETIAAPATPPGESALALVRASGPLVPALAAAVLGRASNRPPPPRRATFGAYRLLDGEILDQVVLTRFAAPASYTGEDLLEITCHGNPLLVHRLLADLFARGCRPAQPGEFTRTAFANGRLDLAQAEAVAGLIRARSDDALRAARRQLDGELSRRIQDFSKNLLEIQAAVEARLDFPEEDLPPEKTGALRAAVAALETDIAALLATARRGTLLRDGASAIIAGPPNAGKSSLLNSLLGRPRAIVSPEPGTTRDFLEERFFAGPYAIQITDTAGLRADPPTAIEREGIARTLEKIASADILLFVIDSAVAPPTLPDEVSNAMRDVETLVLENKTDLSDSQNRQFFLSEFKHLRLSLKTGAGLEQLNAELVKLLEGSNVVAQDDLVLTSARQLELLTRGHTTLLAALAKLDSSAPAELLAADLRLTLETFGDILGFDASGKTPRLDNEAMLDRLFATFCIGK